MRTRIVLGAVLLVALPASAQAPMPPAPAQAATSPGAPTKAPGEYHHDGFFLRITAGATVLRDEYKTDSGAGLLGVEGSGTIDGFGRAHEVSIGGAVAPGLIIAAAFAEDTAHVTKTESEGTAANADDGFLMLTLGPMVDFYPDPDGGLHFEVGAGLGVTGGLETAGVGGVASTGLGAFAAAGYEWWVSAEWALGALLRAHFVSAAGSTSLIFDDLNEEHRAVALSLMFAATYN